MLEVIINLVPFGIKSRRRKLLKIKIANVGKSGMRLRWLDGVRLYSYQVTTVDENNSIVDHGVLIKDFDRTQREYVLVGKVIDTLKSKGVI